MYSTTTRWYCSLLPSWTGRRSWCKVLMDISVTLLIRCLMHHLLSATSGQLCGSLHHKETTMVRNSDGKPSGGRVNSYVKLLPEARLALIPLALLLLPRRLIQLLHSAVDICRVHSGGVIRLRDRQRGGERKIIIEMKEQDEAVINQKDKHEDVSNISYLWAVLLTFQNTFLLFTSPH